MDFKISYKHISVLQLLLLQYFIFNSVDSADRKEVTKGTKAFCWGEKDFLQKAGMINSREFAIVFLVMVFLGQQGGKKTVEETYL